MNGTDAVRYCGLGSPLDFPFEVRRLRSLLRVPPAFSYSVESLVNFTPTEASMASVSASNAASAFAQRLLQRLQDLITRDILVAGDSFEDGVL